jgi:hypothetical protein
MIVFPNIAQLSKLRFVSEARFIAFGQHPPNYVNLRPKEHACHLPKNSPTTLLDASREANWGSDQSVLVLHKDYYGSFARAKERVWNV